MGTAHQYFGDYEVAGMLFQDAARHFRLSKDDAHLALARLKKGSVELQLNRLTQAKENFEYALNYFLSVNRAEYVQLCQKWLAVMDKLEMAIA